MSDSITKDVLSIRERLSSCQCSTCLPCLARFEIERLIADHKEKWRHVEEERNRLIVEKTEALRDVDRLTAERDRYKGQAEINAQTVIRQAKAIRDLEREIRDASRDAASEAGWKHTQGEDYGSY